jgi:serine/threonine protein phosphatase PrpC
MRPSADEIRSLAIHPLDILVAEARYEPGKDSNLQERLICELIGKEPGVPISPEERSYALSTIRKHRHDLEKVVDGIQLPIHEDDEEVSNIIDFLEPIMPDFFALNGIAEEGRAGLYNFFNRFPHADSFIYAWSYYISTQEALYRTDPALIDKAYNAIGHKLYGKQWEYWIQHNLLLQEALIENGLQLSQDVGTVLIPCTNHPDRCDDALAIGKYMLAIADGIGSGGAPSGDIARHAVTCARGLLDLLPPTTEEEARQALISVFSHLGQVTRYTRDRASRLANQGQEFPDTRDITMIGAVGAIGLISIEEDGAYFNAATSGNCRFVLIRKNEGIKETTDRTAYNDDRSRYDDPEVEPEIRERARITVTSSFELKPDLYRWELKEGDIVVAVSDGTTAVMTDPYFKGYMGAIGRDLQDNEPVWTSQKWATDLARHATKHPYYDDISVGVVEVEKPKK